MTSRVRLARFVATLRPLAAHGAALFAAAALAAGFPASAFTKTDDAAGTTASLDAEAHMRQGPEPPAQASPNPDEPPSLPAVSDVVAAQPAEDNDADAAGSSPSSPRGGEDNHDASLAADGGVADGESLGRTSEPRPAPDATPIPGAALVPAATLAASVNSASTGERARILPAAPQNVNVSALRSANPSPDGSEPGEPSGCEFVSMGEPVIEGTPGDDLIMGTPGNDLICGFGGNDRIDGRGGDDRIDGGAGNDRIDGGEGDDCLLGGSGDDRLFGGEGNDLVGGRDGDDQLFGGPGDDSLDGGNGQNRLFGEDGSDLGILDDPGQDEDPEAVSIALGCHESGRVLGQGGAGGLLGDAAGFLASAPRRLAGTEEAQASTPPPPPPPFGVSISSRPVTLEGRSVPVAVACSGPFLKAAGKLTLSTQERQGGRRRKLGTERFECAPFAPTVVAVRLSADSRRLVERERRIRVRGRADLRGLPGQVANARAVFTLTAPRR